MVGRLKYGQSMLGCALNVVKMMGWIVWRWLMWCEGIVEKERGAYQGGVGRVGIEIWTEGNEAVVGHWMLWRIPNVTAASISWLL